MISFEKSAPPSYMLERGVRKVETTFQIVGWPDRGLSKANFEGSVEHHVAFKLSRLEVCRVFEL